MAQNTAAAAAALTPLLRQVKGRLGQLFYQVGESAEYAAVRFGRAVQDASRFAARLAGYLLRPIGASMARGLREAAEDLTAPFRRLHSGFSHIRQAMAAEREHGAGALFFLALLQALFDDERRSFPTEPLLDIALLDDVEDSPHADLYHRFTACWRPS